jgi:hypothetical protein
VLLGFLFGGQGQKIVAESGDFVALVIREVRVVNRGHAIVGGLMRGG